ncbi:MAG: hypothetical protein MUP08_05310 [Desulfobulbaceae bacterium]|jgi:hypothetical protein|nr:hypothetical protein [Desulfobulbaceae bacterium]
MKILEQAKKTMESLPPSELMAVYDMMLIMRKRRVDKSDARRSVDAYKKVRAVLRGCSGSLSEDIIRSREDRI